MPENDFFELLAREALDELDQVGAERLSAMCESFPGLTQVRERFAAIMRSAPGDDTTDASGASLHRAYQIMRQELEAGAAGTERISILRLVYDSLRPVAGLRTSAAAGRRQLMLEDGDLSVDVFIDHGPTGHTISVMLEGENAAEIRVLSGDTRAELAESEGEWRGSVVPGEACLEIRLADRVLRSEPFEIA